MNWFMLGLGTLLVVGWASGTSFLFWLLVRAILYANNGKR